MARARMRLAEAKRDRPSIAASTCSSRQKPGRAREVLFAEDFSNAHGRLPELSPSPKCSAGAGEAGMV